MSTLGKILQKVGLATASEVEALRRQVGGHAHAKQLRDAVLLTARAYAAAQNNRLTQDWTSISSNPLADIRDSIEITRNRARSLYHDDPTGKHVVRTLCMNVPGPKGFSFKCNAVEPDGTSDEVANRIIEEAYYDWSKPQHFSVTGKISRRQFEHLIIKMLVRDGEFLVRKVYNKSKYGFQLQLLDPELLDHTYSTTQAGRGGNLVIMGVEIDVWGKPVAYHIRTPKQASRIYGYHISADRERIPADQIYHGFDFDYACQTRGITWLLPVIMRMRGLADWENFSLINAKLNAALGIVTKDAAQGAVETTGPGTPKQADEEGEPQQRELEVSPAMWLHIGNRDLAQLDTKYPHEQHEPFVRSMRQDIGTGVGFSYPMISGDMSQTNFSSQRFGAANDQENFRGYQSFIIESLLEPMYADWLLMAFTTNRLLLPSGKSLPIEKYDKFLNAGRFTGRTWGFIQPLQDIMAHVVGFEYGVESPIEFFEERGKDIYQVYADIKAAKDLRRKLNIATKLDELDAAFNQLDNPPASQPKEARAAAITSAVRSLRDVLIEMDELTDEARVEEMEDKLLQQVRNILKKQTNGKHQPQGEPT